MGCEVDGYVHGLSDKDVLKQDRWWQDAMENACNPFACEALKEEK